jgi:4'-phosphopantetheinyl transferase
VSGPEPPSLARGDVHVWWFALDREPAELEACAALLAEDERRRVSRYRFPRDRERATAARGLLRVLLGRYAGCAPGALHFDYGPHNKPLLAGSPIDFNLSHCRGLGVCAIALDQPVGVDVEYVQSDLDHGAIASYSFSRAERAALTTQSGPDLARAFFRCWTLKEAYIKARGGGLSIPLGGFDVPMTVMHGGAQPVLSREAAPEAHGWFVRELETEPEFAAAVAVRSPTGNVREWRLSTCGPELASALLTTR